MSGNMLGGGKRPTSAVTVIQLLDYNIDDSTSTDFCLLNITNASEVPNYSVGLRNLLFSLRRDNGLVGLAYYLIHET